MGRLERKDRVLIALVLIASLGLAVASYLGVVAQKSDAPMEHFLRHVGTRIDAVVKRIVRNITGQFQPMKSCRDQDGARLA
jgi:hypothetical protein